MNTANIELLKEMGGITLGEHQPRFIVVGSVGRAAVLGDTLSTLDGNNPKRFQDIDLIDQSSAFSQKYAFRSGALADFYTTPLLRPTEPTGDEWGIFDTITGGNNQLITKLPREALGLHTVEDKESGAKLHTFDACAHIGMIALCDLSRGKLAKHHDQVATLRERQQDLCMGCDNQAFTEAIKEYNSSMNIRLQHQPSPTLYNRTRRTIFTRMPTVAQHIQDSIIGKSIRKVRQSEVVRYDTFNDLLQSTKTLE